MGAIADQEQKGVLKAKWEFDATTETAGTVWKRLKSSRVSAGRSNAGCTNTSTVETREQQSSHTTDRHGVNASEADTRPTHNEKWSEETGRGRGQPPRR